MKLTILHPLLLGLFSFAIKAEETIVLDEQLVNSEQPQVIAYETSFESYTLPFIARDLDVLSGLIEHINNPACRQQCQLIVSGLRNLTTWAVEFYDASGKLPEGVLSGSTYHLGNFDECLDIGRNADDETPPGIGGQYCLGQVNIGVPNEAHDLNSELSPMWKKFTKLEHRYDNKIGELQWGICVPDSCTSEDVQEFIETIFANTLANMHFDVKTIISDKACYKNEKIPITNNQIIYLLVISIVVSVIIIGTVYEAFFMRNKAQLREILPQILVAFSFPANLKKLCGPAHEDLKFECISGIKFLTMVFIIAGHTLIFVVSGPVLNQKFWFEAIGRVENSIFLNNPLLVDTFLLLSGFLFSRILLQELDKRKSINFIFLYIYRYFSVTMFLFFFVTNFNLINILITIDTFGGLVVCLLNYQNKYFVKSYVISKLNKLTPAYMVIVGLYVTWLPRIDSGPLLSRMRLENERCIASWWANILYINNYVNTDKLCMFQSWYLSVDTQLFVLAPAVVYPLWRWRKLGHFILGFVTIFAIILPFIVTFAQELDPTLLIYAPEVKDISMNEYFKSSYIKTHMRAGAYCVGLLYGYIVYRIQNSDTKITKKTVKMGWILSICALVSSMYSISLFYGPRRNFTTVEAAFYSSLHRALWSIGTGWVLLACITDNAGSLRKFLKWRPFVPLSRLTYSAYLVNGLVELHSASTIRVPQHLDTFSLLGKVLSHLTLTFGGAVLLSTMFESPILGIERIFLRRDRKSSGTLTRKPDSEETKVTEA